MTNPKVIRVGNTSVKRGETKKGIISSFEMRDGSSIEIPYFIVNGSEEGPVITAACGVHANEPLGTVATINVAKTLDPKEMRGAFIGVPMMTPSAFHHGWRYNILDLQTISFPGHPKGSLTQRISHFIYKNFFEPTDVFIEWHSNFEPCLAWCSARTTTDEEINKKADSIARSTGLTYIGGPGVRNFPPERTLGSEEIQPKIWVTLEAEGSNTMELRNLRAATKALRNVLKKAEVIDGKIEKMNDDCLKIEAPKGFGFSGYLPPELGFQGNLIRAERGGIVVKEAEDAFIGRKIKEGTIIARIYNLLGDEVEIIAAPCDGYIWGWPLRTVYGLQTPAVYSGAEICYWFVEKELREPYKFTT
jgi:predicted deacylase